VINGGLNGTQFMDTEFMDTPMDTPRIRSIY